MNSAKNIALAGVKQVTLHDTKNATILDLSSQFYLDESDIGKNRALSSLAKVQELNQYVQIDASTEDLEKVPESFFLKYKCIILTDSNLTLQKKINEICHKNNICFISTKTFGVFGYAFTDFGESNFF